MSRPKLPTDPAALHQLAKRVHEQFDIGKSRRPSSTSFATSQHEMMLTPSPSPSASWRTLWCSGDSLELPRTHQPQMCESRTIT